MSMNARWRNDSNGMRRGNQDAIRGLHEQLQPYAFEGAHDIEAATVRRRRLFFGQLGLPKTVNEFWPKGALGTRTPVDCE